MGDKVTIQDKKVEKIGFISGVAQEVCSTILRFCTEDSNGHVYITHSAIEKVLKKESVVPTVSVCSMTSNNLLMDSGHLEKDCIKSWYEKQIREDRILKLGFLTVLPASRGLGGVCIGDDSPLLLELIGLVKNCTGIRFRMVNSCLGDTTAAHVERLVICGLQQVSLVLDSLGPQQKFDSETKRASCDVQISQAIAEEAEKMKREIIGIEPTKAQTGASTARLQSQESETELESDQQQPPLWM